MKLSFSLGNKAKAPVGAAPSLRKPAAFGALEDDDASADAMPVASSSKKRQAAAPMVTNSSWRAGNKKKNTFLDPSVSQYDEVYDEMKEAETRAKAGKEEDNKEKKPKYMEKLLQSAETRKLDFVRAEEKLIQREREQEGEEFADKDKFVTPAYKAQMEEVRRAEEEEKKREEAEAKKRKGVPGLATFFREYLQNASDQRSATVAATQVVQEHVPEVHTNLKIVRPLKIAPDPDSVLKNPDEESEEDLLRKAREEGKDMDVNDDGELVDKRELLSAGLNLSAPNTRRLGPGAKSFRKTEGEEPVHRAAGSAASRHEIRARQQKELERQYQEEQERIAAQQKQEAEEERQRQIKRKNTEDDVMSAKQRYLERKRRKLEEDQAAVVP
ncbi:hypothetical protein FRB94_009426 [Tulasnella sp. JGI-2019a]|nr:hypothetical protein FRB94_009426 [Tulasnella sp. JGI-2019a]